MALQDGALLPVNRKYKPLGISSPAVVDYESRPTTVNIKGLTPATARKIGLKTSGDASNYYLYDVGTIPNAPPQTGIAIKAILSKLSKMTVSPAK